MDNTTNILIEEDEDGRLEIDGVWNAVYGKRMDQHWIDSFSMEEMEQGDRKDIQNKTGEYIPSITAAPMSFIHRRGGKKVYFDKLAG